MRNDSIRRPALTLTCVLLLSTLGCQGKRDGAGGTESAARSGATAADTVAKPADTSARSAADSARPVKGGLTDESILGLLDEANKADSAAGAVAVKKATDPEVKAFAELMISEHHAMRAEGEALAKQLGVTPKPPAKDPIAPYIAAENAALQKAKKGEFDKTYIDNEVTVHQAVLDAANMARVSTSTPELKQLIEKAVPVIRKHLDQAQTLQKKLSPTA